MRTLDESALEPLALGAAILGTGGGGDPYIGKLMARRALATHGPIRVVDPAELPDDAVCVMSAVMGAPTVLVEKLPGGDEQLAALRALEVRLGTPVTHIICAEVGGLNSTLPIVAAAATGLPLVDCDAMGRAFPEIQMSTPTLIGVEASPMALADDKGNVVVVDAVDNRWTERLARSIDDRHGCGGVHRPVRPARSAGQRRDDPRNPGAGRIGRSRSAGSATNQGRSGGRRGTSPRRDSCSSRARFVDVSGAPSQGSPGAASCSKAWQADAGATLEIEFQNENLVASMNARTGSDRARPDHGDGDRVGSADHHRGAAVRAACPGHCRSVRSALADAGRIGARRAPLLRLRP